MVAKILALLLSFAPFSQEPVSESPQARETRLGIQAQVIWDATETRPRGVSRALWGGMLVKLAKAESGLDAYVYRDECETGPYKCDKGRAKGPFQAHQSACPKLWTLKGGSVEWQKYAAACASARLTGAFLRCRSRNPDPLAGSFSGYAGASCSAPWATRRARDARMFASRLGV